MWIDPKEWPGKLIKICSERCDIMGKPSCLDADVLLDPNNLYPGKPCPACADKFKEQKDG